MLNYLYEKTTMITTAQQKLFLIFSRPILKKIINELSSVTATGGGMVDDGPNWTYPSHAAMKKQQEEMAANIGWEIIKNIAPSEFEKNDTEYPKGSIGSSTTMPTRDYKSPKRGKDMKSVPGFNKWKKHMLKVANTTGWEIVKHIDPYDLTENNFEIFKEALDYFYVTNINEIWYIGLTENQVLNNPKNVYKVIYENSKSKMLDKLIQMELTYLSPLDLYNEFKDGKKFIKIKL